MDGTEAQGTRKPRAESLPITKWAAELRTQWREWDINQNKWVRGPSTFESTEDALHLGHPPQFGRLEPWQGVYIAAFGVCGMAGAPENAHREPVGGREGKGIA